MAERNNSSLERFTRLSADSRVLYFFERIVRVPRLSGNMEGISQLILDIAAEHDLEAVRDANRNVIIRIPASSGCESAPSVMVTAHLDMVGARIPGSSHDFDRDPIRLQCTPVEQSADYRISAEGTSLGADDGLGCAYILAMLTEPSLRHPPIEAVFTTEEETDMNGAMQLDYRQFRSRYICNLDGSLLTSSAAGETEVCLSLPVCTEELTEPHRLLRISISGLQGGHSGVNAADERGNAVELLGRVLLKLCESCSCELVSLDGGGTMATAIPQYAEAVLASDLSNLSAVMEEIRLAEQKFNIEMAGRDHCEIHVEEVDTLYQTSEESADCIRTVTVLTDTCRSALLYALQLLPNGIVRREPRPMLDHHRCTVNTGVVRRIGECYSIRIIIRSRLGSLEEWLVEKCRTVAVLSGMNMEIAHRLPAFTESIGKRFRSVIEEAYPARIIETMDGCIECGIFTANMPGAEVISLPVPYYDPHSTGEYFLVSEMEDGYRSFLNLIEKMSAFS